MKQSYKPYEIVRFRQIVTLYDRLQALSRENLESELNEEAISILKQIGYDGYWDFKRGLVPWEGCNYEDAFNAVRVKFQQTKRILASLKQASFDHHNGF